MPKFSKNIRSNKKILSNKKQIAGQPHPKANNFQVNYEWEQVLILHKRYQQF